VSSSGSVRYRFSICDVFTETRFGGNPLAVLPEADGLSARQMQQIAREFNFAETAFVFPAQHAHARRVRIFTPSVEVPFAGHPNIGTAFALASAGEFGPIERATRVCFEQRAGPVAVDIERRGGDRFWCELAAPEPISIGKALACELVASAVSLSASDISTAFHPPQIASVGLPFGLVELRDRRALERARIQWSGFEAIAAEGVSPDLHLYVRSEGELQIRARMFAPLDGTPEDPATGSANCALAGLLARLDARREGSFRFRVAQGFEMGRPSILETRAEKRAGEIVSTHVGGHCVAVAEGFIEVESPAAAGASD
jgi:trans-2,3-dihydro-3-hydroxyanthranilate isomerase